MSARAEETSQLEDDLRGAGGCCAEVPGNLVGHTIDQQPDIPAAQPGAIDRYLVSRRRRAGNGIQHNGAVDEWDHFKRARVRRAAVAEHNSNVVDCINQTRWDSDPGLSVGSSR